MTELDQLVRWYIDQELIVFAALAYAVLAVVAEAGFRCGRWRATRLPAHDREINGLGTLTAGMLSLLAFTLALTISFAQTRFESRRDDVAREANAIGTAFLRAKLIGGADGTALAGAIRAYAALRLDYARVSMPAEAAGLTARAAQQQAEIWALTTAIARRDPNTISSSLIASVNEMFDAGLVQRFAIESRVPVRLIVVLLIGSVLSFGAMGFQFGLTGARHTPIALMLLLMWTGALLLIVDFSDPRQGALRANTAPLRWTLESMGP